MIVASLGTTLGLLSTRVYTVYALAALLTLVVGTPLLAALSRRAQPTETERLRLTLEEAQQGGYVMTVERILVPILPGPPPQPVTAVVAALAAARQDQRLILDVDEVPLDEVDPARASPTPAAVRANGGDALPDLGDFLASTQQTDLVVLAAPRAGRDPLLSFGATQDRIVGHSHADVLMVVGDGDQARPGAAARILVPVDGLGYSISASEVAACLARGQDSELVVFHVLPPIASRSQGRTGLIDAVERVGTELASGLAERLSVLGVNVSHKLRGGDVPAQAILAELATGSYDLIVLGAARRGGGDHCHFGSTVETVLAATETPAVVLVVNRPFAGA
ncbi:MAG: universal stress protein [Acidimicrobiales bacterium]